MDRNASNKSQKLKPSIKTQSKCKSIKQSKSRSKPNQIRLTTISRINTGLTLKPHKFITPTVVRSGCIQFSTLNTQTDNNSNKEEVSTIDNQSSVKLPETTSKRPVSINLCNFNDESIDKIHFICREIFHNHNVPTIEHSNSSQTLQAKQEQYEALLKYQVPKPTYYKDENGNYIYPSSFDQHTQSLLNIAGLGKPIIFTEELCQYLTQVKETTLLQLQNEIQIANGGKITPP